MRQFMRKRFNKTRVEITPKQQHKIMLYDCCCMCGAYTPEGVSVCSCCEREIATKEF